MGASHESDGKPVDQADALLNKALRFTHGEQEVSLARWGLEIREGWYPLVERMLDDIETYCFQNDLPLPRIYQIKQKMALLRVRWISGRKNYSEQAQAAIDSLIDRAAEEAEQRCELCGASPASPVWDDGWLMRLCGIHAKGKAALEESDKTPGGEY